MKRRVLLAAMVSVPFAATAAEEPLRAAVADPRRSQKFVARDGARHPLEELEFFGLRPDATVVEVWPGGGYWTEILAPYLRERGRYVAALPMRGIQEDTDGLAAFRAKLAADPARYDRATVAELSNGSETLVAGGTADAVLTFRNVHNWMKDGTTSAMFASFARALKPHGVLGVEEHRGRADRPQDPRALSGYVRQDYAVELGRATGFTRAASSEIGANPRDTADYEGGVWSLPPTFVHGDVDRARYAAIGEADNFVLRFARG